ncbi:ABC transporter substrate-binding protein [Paenibacillus thalictri]|uniref:Fe3+-hydroxamate ABC transporter substrate-binding protein n=1 Tax=Paenibacillus thalictri TaxID=2527873 RepID=A0A4Q9DEY4_9BACL|nr:ABC transporter substrate-binding protein [Paenibacillus thalictri]TBL70401.1 Fe3+-hydroxamate ABC transporter substrate-binding protein [Paenibacillus thalictri]
MVHLWNKTTAKRLCILMLLAALLTACGGPAPAGTGDAASASSETGSTKIYKDALGREISVPAHPKRVITTQYLPELLAAGVKPAGAATHLLTSFASVKDQIAGIEDIGAASSPNMEKILALQPDLIIATEMLQGQLDQLNKIAPTVVVKWEGSDVFRHFNDVAEVVGQKEKAQEWIQTFNKKGEETRAKLASYVKKEETFGVVVIGGYEKGQLRVYGGGNVAYTLFETLHFPMTETVKKEWSKEGHENGMKISLEKLPEYASADRLFLVRFDNDPDFLKQVDDSMLWKNLPAFKNNKVYTVNPDLWFSYDVMSLSAQLDDVVQLLSK